MSRSVLSGSDVGGILSCFAEGRPSMPEWNRSLYCLRLYHGIQWLYSYVRYER